MLFPGVGEQLGLGPERVQDAAASRVPAAQMGDAAPAQPDSAVESLQGAEAAQSQLRSGHGSEPAERCEFGLLLCSSFFLGLL